MYFYRWTYGSNSLTVGACVFGSLSSMAMVCLGSIKQPFNAGLIIVMLLTFDDNLLPTIDELIASLFGEVFIVQERLGSAVVLVGTILVFLRNTIPESSLWYSCKLKNV